MRRSLGGLDGPKEGKRGDWGCKPAEYSAATSQASRQGLASFRSGHSNTFANCSARTVRILRITDRRLRFSSAALVKPFTNGKIEIVMRRKKEEKTRERPALQTMFAPRSVALIGATDSLGSVGRALAENLRDFPGTFYPVNRNRKRILDIKTFGSITDLADQVDLAIIATPAKTVPEIVRDCAKAGVKGAIIISAGFKEIGERGQELERQIAAERGAMRIIGPNCVGVMLPHLGLNATFANPLALAGNIGFISQSGAL